MNVCSPTLPCLGLVKSLQSASYIGVEVSVYETISHGTPNKRKYPLPSGIWPPGTTIYSQFSNLYLLLVTTLPPNHLETTGVTISHLTISNLSQQHPNQPTTRLPPTIHPTINTTHPRADHETNPVPLCPQHRHRHRPPPPNNPPPRPPQLPHPLHAPHSPRPRTTRLSHPILSPPSTRFNTFLVLFLFLFPSPRANP